MWLKVVQFFGLLGAVQVLHTILLAALFDVRLFAGVLAFALVASVVIIRRRRQSWTELPLKYEEVPEPAVHALNLLEHYRGIVQCDGYAAYKSIANAAGGEAITLAFCWAHLRRRFFDIAKDGSAPIASEALERIAALYAIEKTIRGHSACARRATRQEKSKPLVLALKKWFEQQLARVSAKSVIAEAIRYALHHWDGLTRFLDDGRIELDNNSVERSMRPVALSRKNSLFAGSDEGGVNWACLASLIETALCRARHSADSMRVYIAAARMPPESEPTKR